MTFRIVVARYKEGGTQEEVMSFDISSVQVFSKRGLLSKKTLDCIFLAVNYLLSNPEVTTVYITYTKG